MRPMLAAKVDPQYVFSRREKIIVQPKIDGIRCLVLPDLGPVTRKLKPIPNEHIRYILEDMLWLDGEIVTHGEDGSIDRLHEVQSKVMSREGKPVFSFFAFDHLRHPQLPYHERYTKIKHHAIESYEAETWARVLKLEERFVSEGWEGAILRCPHAPYKFGRSTAREASMLKMKRFIDDEATVVGFVEKMTNTNEQKRDERGYAKRSSAKAGMVAAGTLGALELRWGKVTFTCGSGLDDEMRERIWRNRKKYLGKIVTFKYRERGPNGAPLLPTFRAFRED